MSVEETDDWVFTFNLSKPIKYIGNINDVPNIKINTHNNEITGYTITIKNSSYNVAEEKSKNKANNLANVITIKSGMPVEANLGGYHSIPRKNQLGHVCKTLTLRHGIEGGIKDLDLSDNVISQIVNYTFPHNESYKYLSKAIFHYYNDNPADCIKEGFRIIANHQEFSTSFNEYKALRDLFSHGQTPGNHYKKETIDLFESTFKNDSFEYSKDPSGIKIIIDWKSNKNHNKLCSIAQKLVQELKAHLNLNENDLSMKTSKK